jgi:hypothetical protein
MTDKKFKINGLENVRLYVNQNLDKFLIIVEEKIGHEWHPMIKNEYTLDNGRNFNLNEYILKAVTEFAKKKKIEEDVSDVLNQYENGDEISIND